MLKLNKCSCRYMWEIPACPFAMSHSCQIWYTTKIVPQYFLYNKKTNEWFRVQLKEQDWCGVALWSVLGVCVIHSWPFKEWCFSSKRSFFFYESLYLWVGEDREGALWQIEQHTMPLSLQLNQSCSTYPVC